MDSLEARKAPPRPAEKPSTAPPAGAAPSDYNETLRSRGGHTKFADPCSLAREVRLVRGSALVEVAGDEREDTPVAETDEGVSRAQESMRCLDRNSYDRSKCADVRPAFAICSAGDCCQDSCAHCRLSAA